MKRNSLTILVGALLILIFVLLLFTFQVRQTEIALVTTFEKPSRYIESPGFNWKWPFPIQKVYKFDKRIQSFEQDKIEETLTADSYNLVVQVYVGWSISKPDLFFSSFREGKIEAAQPALEALVRGAKNAIVGKHPFTDFVSKDKSQLKFTQIEQEILKSIQPPALNTYGIEVKFLGIKKLGLPESVTQKVFDRMIAERQQQVEKLKSEGEREAAIIRSNADAERDEIRAKADAEAITIKGEADAQAAKSYAIFEQAPELAILLRQLRALEDVTKDRTTLILDERTRPFNLLTSPATNVLPAAPSSQLNNGAFQSRSKGGETRSTASTNTP
ncbi:MAG: protease modulator HflC [Verrucomicrobiota bacterium]